MIITKHSKVPRTVKAFTGQLDSLPSAGRMITDGFGGRMHRRGVIAIRQEHDELEPEKGRHRLDTAHHDGLHAVAIVVGL